VFSLPPAHQASFISGVSKIEKRTNRTSLFSECNVRAEGVWRSCLLKHRQVDPIPPPPHLYHPPSKIYHEADDNDHCDKHPLQSSVWPRPAQRPWLHYRCMFERYVTKAGLSLVSFVNVQSSLRHGKGERMTSRISLAMLSYVIAFGPSQDLCLLLDMWV